LGFIAPKEVIVVNGQRFPFLPVGNYKSLELIIMAVKKINLIKRGFVAIKQNILGRKARRM
jgi:hypothetical protein